MTSWTSTGGSRFFFKRPGYGLGLMLDPDWGYGGLYGHGGDGEPEAVRIDGACGRLRRPRFRATRRREPGFRF